MIYLDDVREAPAGCILARNSAEFKSITTEAHDRGEQIEEISFDNDLGEGDIEGRECLRWYVENFPQDIGKVKIKVHSANPVAEAAMKSFIEWSKNHKADFLEMKLDNNHSEYQIKERRG